MKITDKMFAEMIDGRFAPKTPIVPNPKEDEANIIAEILAAGYKLVDKTKFSAFPNSTTTYHGRIARSVGFAAKIVIDRVVIYRHESVHMYQRKKKGRHAFNAAYIFDRGFRLVSEVQADREEARVLVAYGQKREILERWAKDQAMRYSKPPYFLFSTKKNRDVIEKALLHGIL